MKKIALVLLVMAISFSSVLVGCGPKKTESSSAAINTSEALTSVQEKVDYLLKQANAFYNSKEYKDAIDLAQYALLNLDKNSQGAKSMIEKATNKLKAEAQSMAAEMQKKLENLGK